MKREELEGKKVGVLGLGANNRELVRFLVRQRAVVTVRDKKEAVVKAFQEAFPELKERVEWEVREDVLKGLNDFDIVFRTPAIPYLSPALRKAEHKGVKVYSQTRLFFDLCPCRIIGVSGTKGKGTTASLLHQILVAGYHGGNSYLAGNIGLDPFAFLDQLQPSDLVVLELSSFQLQDLHASPQIAILLSVTSDHLDHHRDLAEYRAAKRQLLAHQKEEDIAIINVQEPAMEEFASATPARVYRYAAFRPRRQSAWVNKEEGRETLFVQVGERLDTHELTGRKLLGDHNLENIIPAVLAATLLGVEPMAMDGVVRDFTGLPHRLTKVGTFGEVDFYDDSIATTPEAVIVALKAVEGRRIHLIAGGNDKGASYTTLANEVADRCVTVSLLPGTATAKLLTALRKVVGRRADRCLILDQARDPLMTTILSGIQPHLQPGDVVLLSPAATSFASFANYSERGEVFAKAVHQRFGGPI